MGITLTTNPSFHRKVNVLIDTGSLRQDFVSPTIAQCLSESGALIRKIQGLQRCRVCTLNECTLVGTIVSFSSVFFNETTKTNETITIHAWVLPTLPYDIIIGRPTVERERLLFARKISLSGNEFRFSYKLPTPAAGVAPLCAECTPMIAKRRRRVRRRPLRFAYILPHPVFYDPAGLTPGPRPKPRPAYQPIFTHAAAVDIVKKLRSIAASNINNTLTILGKDIREGRLRGAAPLDEFATHQGLDDTVTAPLTYLYFLNELSEVFLKKEFTRNAKYSIDQYLYLMHVHRVSKDELLDPILDDDTIDYSRENIPWEQTNKIRRNYS